MEGTPSLHLWLSVLLSPRSERRSHGCRHHSVDAPEFFFVDGLATQNEAAQALRSLEPQRQRDAESALALALAQRPRRPPGQRLAVSDTTTCSAHV